MKGYTHDNSKEFHSASLAKPLYAAGEVRNMPRDVPKSVPGNGFKLTSNAKYGVDGSQGPTTMSRDSRASSGGMGKSSLPPATANRYTQGVDGAGCRGYGVEGVGKGAK